MFSIQDCVNAELQKRPFYLQMLQDGLLNASVFAGQIKPKVESQLSKSISVDTLIACLSRSKRTLEKRKFTQKIHSVKIKYPLVWESFHNVIEKQKQDILCQLPHLNSYYENKDSMIVTYKEKLIKENITPILKNNSKVVRVDSVCEITIEYHDKYHSETGILYEIAKEFYWNDISIIDQANSDHLVWVYIESKNVSAALGILREKFIVSKGDK